LKEKLGNLFGENILGVKRIKARNAKGKVLRQVINAELGGQTIDEIWEGAATVEFMPTAEYPYLHEFQLRQGDIVAAFYARPEFIISYGNVIYDRYE